LIFAWILLGDFVYKEYKGKRYVMLWCGVIADDAMRCQSTLSAEKCLLPENVTPWPPCS